MASLLQDDPKDTVRKHVPNMFAAFWHQHLASLVGKTFIQRPHIILTSIMGNVCGNMILVMSNSHQSLGEFPIILESRTLSDDAVIITTWTTSARTLDITNYLLCTARNLYQTNSIPPTLFHNPYPYTMISSSSTDPIL